MMIWELAGKSYTFKAIDSDTLILQNAIDHESRFKHLGSVANSLFEVKEDIRITHGK